MREILFRGKQVGNGEWVEGNLITGKWYLDEREIVAIAPLDNAFYPHCEMSEWYEVDPATVGQYTGLTDKNGKKIFEGDIVEEYDIWGEFERFGTVSWHDLFCAWHIGKPKAMYNSPVASYVVIGNIHDNRELLEG